MTFLQKARAIADAAESEPTYDAFLLFFNPSTIKAMLNVVEAAINNRDVKGRHHSEIAFNRLSAALAALEELEKEK